MDFSAYSLETSRAIWYYPKEISPAEIHGSVEFFQNDREARRSAGILGNVKQGIYRRGSEVLRWRSHLKRWPGQR